MAISKKKRKIVYQKYGGRCAYCGKAISLKEMTVDHFIPLRRGLSLKKICSIKKRSNSVPEKGTDDITNLMPSCHFCNTLKADKSIEEFREELLKRAKKAAEGFGDFGLVKYQEKQVKFFFETSWEKELGHLLRQSEIEKRRISVSYSSSDDTWTVVVETGKGTRKFAGKIFNILSEVQEHW